MSSRCHAFPKRNVLLPIHVPMLPSFGSQDVYWARWWVKWTDENKSHTTPEECSQPKGKEIRQKTPTPRWLTLSLLLMQQVINISTFFLYHRLITVYLFIGSQVKHSKGSNCTETRQRKPNLTQTQKVKSGRKRPNPGNTLHMMFVLLIQNVTPYYRVISIYV